MNLPRFHIEGHIYYITTVIYNRLPIFTRPSFIIPLYDSLNFYRYKQEFKLLGYVIMPDHIHLIIWPFGKSTVSGIMRDYKTFTSKRIIRQAEVEDVKEWAVAFEQAGRETKRSANKVWQDSYWDVNVWTLDKSWTVIRNPFFAKKQLQKGPKLPVIGRKRSAIWQIAPWQVTNLPYSHFVQSPRTYTRSISCGKS